MEKKNDKEIIVLATIEGNGNRPSHLGAGISVGGGTMYTLNTAEVHGVVIRRVTHEPK